MENSKTVTIERKNVYGNVLNYPVCKNAKLFAQMVSRKTLTKDDLQSILNLGYRVLIHHPETEVIQPEAG